MWYLKENISLSHKINRHNYKNDSINLKPQKCPFILSRFPQKSYQSFKSKNDQFSPQNTNFSFLFLKQSKILLRSLSLYSFVNLLQFISHKKVFFFIKEIKWMEAVKNKWNNHEENKKGRILCNFVSLCGPLDFEWYFYHKVFECGEFSYEIGLIFLLLVRDTCSKDTTQKLFCW